MNARKVIAGILALLGITIGIASLASPAAFAVKGYAQGVSFGKLCTSEPCPGGQFKEPVGVAVNSSTELVEAAGDVYVVDKGGNRVERFGSAGTYRGEFDGSGTFEVEGKPLSGQPAPTGRFSEPDEIAVDNSTGSLDPSVGDVYVMDTGHSVIDKFSPVGAYLGQLTAGKGNLAFKNLHGVAVDSSGNVWVYVAEGEVEEFSPAGAFLTSFATERSARPGMALDSTGGVYVISGEGKALKYNSSSGFSEATFSEAVTAIATEPSPNDVLLDKGSKIELYAPIESGSEPRPFDTFASEGALSDSHGLAINNSDGTVYASESTAGNVKTFDYVSFPTVSAGPASGVTETGASLHGTVDLEGESAIECRFEYGAEAFPGEISYGQEVPCMQTPAEISKGPGPVAVSAEVSGLSPLTTYHFRLYASNKNGSRSSADETLGTVSHPTVEGETLSNVQGTSATLGAQVNAGGLPTSFHVDYGTSAEYGSSTAEVGLGDPRTAVGALARIIALESGTKYHARMVATSSLGTTYGADVTFTTTGSLGSSALVLPDNRAYELVSPQGNQDVYAPLVKSLPADTTTIRPFRASADGDSVAYFGDPPASGGSGVIGAGLGDAYLATRTSSGWKAEVIQPPGTQSVTEFTAFSDDLATGIVTSPNRSSLPPLSPDAPANCNVLYLRDSSSGAYRALFTTTDTPGECGNPVFAGSSADGSRLFFQTAAALNDEAAVDPPSGNQEDLYESRGGHLRLVNVLAGKPVPNATFGGPRRGEPEERYFSNAISLDGSRVFWTDIAGKKLYVNEDGASPAQVDAAVGGGGEYWTATPDGSIVFFTKEGNLYSFDVKSGQTTDLVPGAEVQGVVDVSEDGAYVYFVARAKLTPDASAQTCSPPVGTQEEQENLGNLEGRGCNLYVLHAGSPVKFIASLAPSDNNLPGPLARYGDWLGDPGYRAAAMTADGRDLVFVSRQPLTGYNNGGTPATQPMPEIFRYEAEAHTDGLACVSCNRSGEPPVHQTYVGAFLSRGSNHTFTLRSLSQDGSRVFFDTEQALVPQDSNGQQDVYEWERDGVGSCAQKSGCIYLLSGGVAATEAYFIDASANGNDVFIADRAVLSPEAVNENVKLYDLRVNGRIPQVSEACTGTGCQGVPPAPPIFATPASATFSGVGNFPTPASSEVKPKAKAKVCRKGFAKRHGRCVRTKKRPSRHSKKGRK